MAMDKNATLIILVLIFIGVAYYIFVYKKQKPAPLPQKETKNEVELPQSYTQIKLEGKDYSKLHGISEIIDSLGGFFNEFGDFVSIFKKNKQLQDLQNAWNTEQAWDTWNNLSKETQSALCQIPGSSPLCL